MIDEDGVPMGGVRRSTPARELIEELMVLANQSVAKMLHTKGGVFRVHERPDQESLELGRGSPPSVCRPSRRLRLPDGQVRRGELPDPSLHTSRHVFARRPRTLRSRARALHALHVPDPALRRRPRTPRPAGRRASRGPRRSRSAHLRKRVQVHDLRAHRGRVHAYVVDARPCGRSSKGPS